MRAVTMMGLFSSATAFGLLALLGDLAVGCSADGAISPPQPPVTDAAIEAAPALEADAGSPDGATCDDCAFFLPTCEAQSFCPVDLTNLGVTDTRVTLNAVRGTSPSDVWAAGARGTVLHLDGTGWSKVSGPDVSFTGLATPAAADVWLASTLSLIFIRTAGSDGAWRQAALVPLLADAHVNGMWSAADATWMWLAVTSEPYAWASALNLKRVRRGATGHRFEEPFDCDGDCPAHLQLGLRGIHGISKDDLWAVGEAGTAYRVLAAETVAPSLVAHDSRTTATLHGVWSSAPEDVWVVGSNGTLRHYTGTDGQRFEVVESPVTSTLRSVWGTSKTDVWAVGDGGVVLHYDGTAWSRVPVGGVVDKPDLYAVWAATPSHVWAAGQGVLLELSTGGGS